MIETLNLNVAQPKQGPVRFPSIGNLIYIIPAFENNWATPRHTAIGGS